MSPPHHISSPLLLPTTGLQVNTSSKPSDSYSTTGQHVPTSPYILFSTTTYHRSTRRQNPHKHTSTSTLHLLLYYYLLQVHRSTRRQNPQNRTLLLVNVSPSRHISHSLLLPTTGLQVNTSSNPQNYIITTGHHVTTSPYLLSSTTTYYRSTGKHIVKTLRFILYYRSTCPHLAIYLILYYYLLQVYRSTRRQNPHKHTSTTGHHVPTSPYILFSTTTYYRSTDQHVVKTPRIIPLPQVTMSPPHHISYSLLLLTTGLQVNTSTKLSESYSTTGQHDPTSPYILFSTTTYYRSTCQHVVKTLKIIPHYRSPCPHLTIYIILYYYLPQVCRSTCRQNPQNIPVLQVTM